MTVDPPDTPIPVGLSPAQLIALFPFHIVLNRELRIIQVGRSLSLVLPHLKMGQAIAELLHLRRPHAEWSADLLSKSTDLLLIAEHEPTQMLLRGQVIPMKDAGNGFIFLASPWLEGPETLDRFGLKLGDFALHDVSLDLIQVVQSMRIANADLRRLTDILKGHRSELQRVNAEVSARNEQLEITTRDLADAQEIAELGSWRYRIAEDRLEWSDEFVRIFGIPDMEAGATLATWLSYVHPDDRLRVESAIRNIGSDSLHLDFRIIRADGRRRYVHLRSRVDKGSLSKLIRAGTLQDITRRKLNEKLLRSQRKQIRKLALVASSTDNGVLITDSDGRIEWANMAFRRQSGYAPKVLRGRKPGELLQVPETSGDTIRHMRQKLAAREAFSVELLNAAADGRRYWAALEVQPVLDSKGTVTHFISVQRDVTEARRQQAALERLRAERDMILELSPDGFLAFDEAGLPVYSNPAASHFFGIDPSQLAQMAEDDVDALLSTLTDAKEGYVRARDQADGAVDVLSLRKTRTIVRRAVRVVRDSGGHVSGRVIYFRDVTREKELDRMRTEFLATAAHELRTPMSSIHGFSELLMTRELDSPTRREVVETIHSQSNFVVRMVNDLLDLERLSSGTASGELRIQPISLIPVIRRVLDGLMVEGDPRRVDFSADPDDEYFAVADPDKLAQALINLLANAYRYSRAKGGPIGVHLHRHRRQLRAEIGISVRDHGIGMTGDQIEKVFERFYRADPSSAVSGTGLGMTLVKEIAERMGGRVEIDSTPNVGTTVTLWVQESDNR
jgi:PAS domain S-box-containing protein